MKYTRDLNNLFDIFTSLFYHYFMSFGESIKTCFQKYQVLKGRASRSEFWYFYLFHIIVSIVCSVLDYSFFPYIELQPLSTIFTLVIFCPYIAVTARRLHDVNRSGWWMLIPFTIIGIIPFAYWLCKKGDKDQNRFGNTISLN